MTYVPDHRSYIDHRQEQDEIHTCVTWTVWKTSSSKMLVQALQLNAKVPRERTHHQKAGEEKTFNY